MCVNAFCEKCYIWLKSQCVINKVSFFIHDVFIFKGDDIYYAKDCMKKGLKFHLSFTIKHLIRGREIKVSVG